MFRLLGVLLVSVSAGMYSMKSRYKLLQEKIFFKETADIVRYINLHCGSGQTYPVLFSNYDFSKTKFYRDFCFPASRHFFDDISAADEAAKMEIFGFFSNLGKNSSVKEKTFIAENLKIFEYRLKKAEEKCANQLRLSRVLSRSLGLFIFIIGI